MSYVIGLDVGTQSTKAVLVDTQQGTIVASSSSEHGISIPKALYVEQDGDVWVESSYDTIKKLLNKVSIAKEDIKAIGISGLYGGSGIAVDKNMNPIFPCIIWMDRRAEEEVSWVNHNIDTDDLFRTTGNGVNSYFGFTKMMWIRNNVPDVWKNINYFIPPNNYIIYKMTGEIAVDYSSAGNIGGVYDINQGTWSDRFINMLGLDRSMFPNRLVEGDEVVGTLLPEVADYLGLSKDTQVVSGGIDAPASLLATGIDTKGQHVAMMGTSTCWGFLTSADILMSPDLVSMPFVIDGKHTLYTFGGTSTSGALVTWFIDNFFDSKPNNVFEILGDYVKETPPGSEGLLTLPYFAGERSPIWDAYASGVFYGLGLHHSKKHIYRSILEGTAFSLRHNMELVNTKNSLSKELIVVGGTSKSKEWLQIISDVTNYPIKIIKEEVEAPLGSAILAALGSGLIKEKKEASTWVTIESVCIPNQSNMRVYDEMYMSYIDVYKNTHTNMKKLKTL